MTREEILQAFDDINFVYNDCTRYDTLKRMLEELTERKRGEWIVQDGEVVCSECFEPNLETNYCPNCGCAMTKENDDERN
mgnify:CR=1 FL=1